MTDSEIAFLPFHAINEFMTTDYRLEVVREVLSALPEQPGVHAAAINQIVRQSVKIPGFRLSDKAPAAVKTRPVVREFEKNPLLVAAILALWADLHADLRQEVYACLTMIGWELLPIDADRTQLPGFLPTWPAGQDFNSTYAAYQEKYPSSAESINNVSLMTVWLSGRLPYPTTAADDELP
jgi:hypothetical protein